MLDSIESSEALRVIDSFRPRLGIPQQERLKVWGPVKANKYDSADRLILEDATVLVQRENHDWVFVHQPTRVTNGSRWTAPPFATTTTPEEARRWLQANKLDAAQMVPDTKSKPTKAKLPTTPHQHQHPQHESQKLVNDRSYDRR